MRVRDFMKANVITVDIKTPVMESMEIMKTNNIKRLPVMKKGKLVGLITRAMLRDASPSKATTLSVYELNYLISKLTVGDIMVKDPITISPDLPVEEAIWLGTERRVGAFPVVENGELKGIITESDISGIVVKALGVGDSNSKRITIDASGRRFGYLKDLVQVLDNHNIPILSIMGIPKADKNDWFLILRVRTSDASKAVNDMQAKGFQVMDVT